MKSVLFGLLLIGGIASAQDITGASAHGSWIGSSIGDSLINSVWFRSQPHDTTFEKIKEIRQKCDTVVDRSKVLASGPGYVTYGVTIECAADTVWVARDDLRLTADDIVLLIKFLRGKWSPQRDDPFGYIQATPAIQWLKDSTIPLGVTAR